MKKKSFIYRKYRNRIRFVSIVDGEDPSTAWAACVRMYKGNTPVVWVPHSKAHSDGHAQRCQTCPQTDRRTPGTKPFLNQADAF